MWQLINDPAQINSNALNIAWVIMWKNAKLGRFSPNLIIINPNWLSVDRAIIFFISHSVKALNPAISMVHVAIISSKVLNKGRLWRKL